MNTGNRLLFFKLFICRILILILIRVFTEKVVFSTNLILSVTKSALYKQAWIQTYTFRKREPQTVGKIESYTKLNVSIKDSLMRNLRVLISNMTIVFKFLAQTYPDKEFLVPNLGNLVFLRNCAVTQTRGCWFQIWQYCFQIPVQKYPNKVICILFFSRNFTVWQFFVADIKCYNNFLSVNVKY